MLRQRRPAPGQGAGKPVYICDMCGTEVGASADHRLAQNERSGHVRHGHFSCVNAAVSWGGFKVIEKTAYLEHVYQCQLCRDYSGMGKQADKYVESLKWQGA